MQFHTQVGSDIVQEKRFKVSGKVRQSTKQIDKQTCSLHTTSFGSLSTPFRTGFCRKLLITCSVRLAKGESTEAFFDRKVSWFVPIVLFPYAGRPCDVCWSGSFVPNWMILPTGFWLEEPFNMLMPPCKELEMAPWSMGNLGAIPNFIMIFVIAC